MPLPKTSRARDLYALVLSKGGSEASAIEAAQTFLQSGPQADYPHEVNAILKSPDVALDDAQISEAVKSFQGIQADLKIKAEQEKDIMSPEMLNRFRGAGAGVTATRKPGAFEGASASYGPAAYNTRPGATAASALNPQGQVDTQMAPFKAGAALGAPAVPAMGSSINQVYSAADRSLKQPMTDAQLAQLAMQLPNQNDPTAVIGSAASAGLGTAPLLEYLLQAGR